MEKKQEVTNSQNRTNAMSFAALRAVVAAYLIYLGISLIADSLRGTSTLSPAFAWSIGLFFIAAGLAFGYYLWKRWQSERAVSLSRGAEDPSDLQK